MMSETNEPPSGERQGLVVSASRRNAHLSLPGGEVIVARVSPKIEEITVGDVVLFSTEGDQYYVQKVKDRKNCLSRTYRKKNQRDRC